MGDTLSMRPIVLLSISSSINSGHKTFFFFIVFIVLSGIKKSSSSANDADILLQVSDMPNDICISMLSDDDFSEVTVLVEVPLPLLYLTCFFELCWAINGV